MQRRGRSNAEDLLAPSALAALRATIRAFGRAAQERGLAYAARGSVTGLVVDERGARATVRGTRVYETAWIWAARGCAPSCTCPVAPYCKHAYALACVLLDEADLGADESPFADAHHVDDVQRRQTGRARWSPANVAAIRGPAPPVVLHRIRTAAASWERQSALHLLFVDAPVLGLYRHPEIVSAIEDPDPELRCWRLARAVARQTDGWVPPELASYCDQPALAARHRERARRLLASELVEWSRRRSSAPQRQLRVVLGLAPAWNGTAIVTCEARVTTPRLADAPRTAFQLQQLRSEVRRNPSLLAPAHVALLELIADEAIARDLGTPILWIPNTTLRSLLAGIATPAFAASVSWREDVPADLAARTGIESGGPVRFGAAPARLVPTCLAGDDGPLIDLVFVWPDGRQCPCDQAVHVPSHGAAAGAVPGFVLAAGEFSLVVDEPPRVLLDRFAEASGSSLPIDEREEVLATLAASFPHVADAVRAHTRFHRVAAAMTLELRDDDWLHLRAFAIADAAGGGAFECRSQAGWARVNREELTAITRPLALVEHAAPAVAECAGPTIEPGPAAALPVPTAASQSADESLRTPAPLASIAEGDVWLEAPDPAVTDPLVDWLVAVGASPGTASAPSAAQPPWEDRDLGWWMRTSRKRMDAFADAWERRPPGVEFFGDERVRRLLAPRQRVAPRVRVTASGVDWLAVAPAWEHEGARLSDADLAKLRTASARFVRLAGGWVRRDLTTAHDEGAALLADLGIEPDGGEQRVTVWQLAGAKPESIRALVRLGADPAAVEMLERLRARVASFAGLSSIAVVAGLRATLRPYQQQGLDFLAHASSLGLGAVLADDMGLGKTVQALAWLLHLRASAPHDGPALVVCPASVVHNWLREAERFAPELRVLALTSGSGRHALRRAIPEHDLVITTYALLRRDVDHWREIELRAAILDEAQNIKNPDAVVAGAARALRARHRLALTGTPLENRALDLWSIVSFVNPGYLGNRAEFGARFDRPDAPPHTRALLAAKLRPILLRRLKREVATDLPDRIEERRDCELTKGQRQLYLAELRRSRALIDELGGTADGVRRNKITILAALTRLRQICCHPALGGGKASLGSGKFDALFELLEPLMAEGHKVLLFSQFVRCLQLLRTDLATRGVTCHLLTGATVKREAVVRAFTDDERPSVFLISLKAGGTGLNLTSASYVVLFDPWWNPAVEAQAIDRTHRIGQDRTVVAYRLLALGTIEEKIFELQQRKAALARDVLGEDGFARALTRDDLAYLLAES
jgi:superfamily II DNA or RNA helicase